MMYLKEQSSEVRPEKIAGIKDAGQRGLKIQLISKRSVISKRPALLRCSLLRSISSGSTHRNYGAEGAKAVP